MEIQKNGSSQRCGCWWSTRGVWCLFKSFTLFSACLPNTQNSRSSSFWVKATYMHSTSYLELICNVFYRHLYSIASCIIIKQTKTFWLCLQEMWDSCPASSLETHCTICLKVSGRSDGPLRCEPTIVPSLSSSSKTLDCEQIVCILLYKFIQPHSFLFLWGLLTIVCVCVLI